MTEKQKVGVWFLVSLVGILGFLDHLALTSRTDYAQAAGIIVLIFWLSSSLFALIYCILFLICED